MKFHRLVDIWVAEQRLDELRWSAETPLQDLSGEDLDRQRREVTDALEALSPWLSRLLLLPGNRSRIARFKRKLLEFQWLLIHESQSRERARLHSERMDRMLEPEARGDALPTPDFGLRTPLKGSDFYKQVPRELLRPVPRGGAV